MPFSSNAFLIAKLDRAQVDLLDQAARAIDRGDVADAHLILEDQEEPADDVAHHRLGAEADRQSGDARSGQHRCDVDPQLVKNHQHCDRDDGDGRDLAEKGAQRAGALRPLERVETGAGGQLVLESLHHEVCRADQRVGENHDQRDLQT